jgi:hypothetical protein
MATKFFDQSFIWPKLYLTKALFDHSFIWPQLYSTIFFCQNYIRRKLYLTKVNVPEFLFDIELVVKNFWVGRLQWRARMRQWRARSLQRKNASEARRGKFFEVKFSSWTVLARRFYVHACMCKLNVGIGQLKKYIIRHQGDQNSFVNKIAPNVAQAIFCQN